MSPSTRLHDWQLLELIPGIKGITGSIAILVFWAVVSLPGADWPRLGGAEGLGSSPEKGLARHWPEGGPRVLWQVEVGEGFAGPAIYDGKVYLLDRPDEARDVLRCFDLTNGGELWRQAYEAPGRLPYNGSRNVPTVTESFVFTIGPFGHIRCYDRGLHSLVWSGHLVDDFKESEAGIASAPQNREEQLAPAQLPRWGLTQAPLLYRDLVIAAPQTRTVGLVAYEQATGKIRWRSGYIGRNWYSHVSPALIRLCGVDQILMLAQPSDPEKPPEKAPPAILSSVDPITGRILWTQKTPAPYKLPIPQPAVLENDRVFVTGGYGLGSLIYQVTYSNAQWQAVLVTRDKTVAAHMHSPAVFQDRLYVTSFKEHGAAFTGLACLNRKGEPLWQTGPALQFESGGYLIVDGLIVVMHGKTGELHLLEPDTGNARVLAKARVLEAKGGMAWAPLAFSQGRLLVRDQHQMKCLDLRPDS
ncbi:MAG TPA: PQQ-binding-like beta-propeller repeat protein [Candidatus Paceibacterota bacterium]|nr:PQQ-binding-like beta-propeller repeat protein [Verrucomicrobiota bacterium]HRY47033.1 PQQ-binding-like beta-propeller repeat protein [Candidatus Paceibacterota bacterium]HRZ99579.1 PQQ-binding-like beta-propeller repeat protein [Candidatus Paceibacterota bacterium]